MTLLNPHRFPAIAWTQILDFLAGTGAFPDANGWALNGQSAKRTFVSGQGMRILDNSTSGGQLCWFDEVDIDPGDAPFHLRTTVKCDAASSDAFACYLAAYGSDRGIQLILRADKVRWQGAGNLDISLDMTGFHQLDLCRIADTVWILTIDGTYGNAGAGLITTDNKVELGAGSSGQTSDSTWKNWMCKVGSAFLPNGREIKSYQAITASGAITSSGTDHDAFPGLAHCPDGSYLAMWRHGTAHDSTDGEIYKATSTDQGATWGTPAPVFTFGTDLRDVGLTRHHDRIIATFTDSVTAGSDLVPYFAYSDDSGATWSTPTAIDHGFSDWAVVAAPIVVDNGDWYACLFGLDVGDPDWSSVIVKSSDEGANWAVESTVWDGTTAGSSSSEPCLIQVGVEWICSLRREDLGDTAFYVASSPAGPWSLRSTHGGLGRPNLAHINDELWLMNRNTEKRIAASFDAGLHWIPMFDTPSGTAATMTYGQMVQRPDGKVLLVYAEEDVDQGASRVRSAVVTVG